LFLPYNKTRMEGFRNMRHSTLDQDLCGIGFAIANLSTDMASNIRRVPTKFYAAQGGRMMADTSLTVLRLVLLPKTEGLLQLSLIT